MLKTFCRDNFALLKIYYTEWNYEMVSEKPDYDVSCVRVKTK